MVFSKTWGYAVRALIYLARHQNQGTVLSSRIAKDENIPAPFLAKILGTLAIAKIVVSSRGPKGGFKLNVPPEDLTLMEITTKFGTPDAVTDCLIGDGECVEGASCPIHKKWSESKKQIMKFLQTTTLADISKAEQIHSKLITIEQKIPDKE